MRDVSKLVTGDWVRIKYGSKYHVFYVCENDVESRLLTIGSPEWCISCAETIGYDKCHLKEPWSYLGRGKLRWLFKYMPNWIYPKDLICPFTYPKRG